MTQPTPDLARLIRQLRQERAWSQAQLADIAGLSERTVQRIERGLPASQDTLMALAGALDVPVAVLVEAAPADPAEPARRLGLTAAQASWAGAILSLPLAAFISLNLAVYQAGQTWLAPLLPSGLIGAVWASPLILIGGPLTAIALNLPHAFRIRVRDLDQGRLIDGVLIAWDPARLGVILVAGALLGVVATYLLAENLGHLVRDAVAEALTAPAQPDPERPR